ncbi:MAG: hypothetical protein QOJ99_2896 [Bryobacterales bacterium]|jgi:hypothetical protein|nr:hypothetical protein [Bryobacterales bacterium]
MTLVFVTTLFFIVAGLGVLHFYTRFHRLEAFTSSVRTPAAPALLPTSNRYQPMLRLLSPDDEVLVSANRSLAKKLKKQRMQIFREYLSCLSADYGRLLAGVRSAMASSGIDRPDLAAAVAKNEALFALALCRVEYRLFLHSLGLSTVDVSGLVESIAVLRSQVSAFNPAMSAVR